MFSRGAVQEILGHKDIATTLRFYGHVFPSMRRHAALVLDESELGSAAGSGEENP